MKRSLGVVTITRMATGIILSEQDGKSGRGDRGLAMEGREKTLSGKHEEIKNYLGGIFTCGLRRPGNWNVELLAQVWCHHCIKVHCSSSWRGECDTPCGDRQTGADQTAVCDAQGTEELAALERSEGS